MPSTSTETSPVDALFASILAGAVAPASGNRGNGGGSCGAYTQSSAQQGGNSGASEEKSQGGSQQTIQTSMLLDLTSRSVVWTQTAQPTAKLSGAADSTLSETAAAEASLKNTNARRASKNDVSASGPTLTIDSTLLNAVAPLPVTEQTAPVAVMDGGSKIVSSGNASDTTLSTVNAADGAAVSALSASNGLRNETSIAESNLPGAVSASAKANVSTGNLSAAKADVPANAAPTTHFAQAAPAAKTDFAEHLAGRQETASSTSAPTSAPKNSASSSRDYAESSRNDATPVATPAQATANDPANKSAQALSELVNAVVPSAVTFTNVPAPQPTNEAVNLIANAKLTAAPQSKASAASTASSPAKVQAPTDQPQASSAGRPTAGNVQTSSDPTDAGSTAINAATSKAATGDGASLPIQAAPQKTTGHDVSASGGGADASSHASAIHSSVAGSGEAGSTAITAGVSTANLVQSMQQTEMRVGMRSAEFGEISIRSTVSQQQVTAQISASHSELAQAISGHLPSLQAKLDHYGLHASIEVSQGGTSFGGEREQASAKDQRPRNTAFQMDNGAAGTEQEPSASRSDYLAADGRVDIRA